MTKIYVGGREVREEDLENIEITSDVVKKILAEKLASKSEGKEQ